ncbi:MAG TPA: hypothetical protein VFZ48_02590 [Candidatus Saccharimonadales bacterium]
MHEKYKYIIYGLVACCILGTLLLPGYIFTLDSPFVPHMPMPSQVTASFLYTALLSLLSAIIPSFIVQKLLLFLILLFSGLGAHNLVKHIAPNATPLIWYFAGLLYMVNPFTYSHFMVGQYAVLLGYIMLPFVIIALLKFLEKPAVKSSGMLAGSLVLMSIFSIHTLGIAATLAVPIVGLWTYRNRANRQWFAQIFRLGLLAVTGFIAASSYWLVPLLFGNSKTSQVISGFTQADYTAFATNGDSLGVIGNILALRGFWADSTVMYKMPEDIFGWWFVPIILFWVLLVLGIVRSYKLSRGLTIAFGLGLIAALIFATGITDTPFAGLNQWLIAHIPLFAGYREPHKFVMIIALAYAYFGSMGVLLLLEKIAKLKNAATFKIAVVGPLLLIPLLMAPLTLWGFAGQLKATDYPKDWYEMNKLIQQKPQAKVLFLPWHQYMDFDFAGRIVINPADIFFTNHTVTSNDPEYKGSHSGPSSTDQKYVQEQLLPLAASTDAGDRWSKVGFSYILLAKEFDYKKYDYLDKQTGLRLIKQTENLMLYEVTPGREQL